MGSRNIGRDGWPMVSDTTELASWVRDFPEWRISIFCRSCFHAGSVNPRELLLSDPRLRQILDLRVRLKCAKCKARDNFDLKPAWTGKRRD